MAKGRRYIPDGYQAMSLEEQDAKVQLIIRTCFGEFMGNRYGNPEQVAKAMQHELSAAFVAGFEYGLGVALESIDVAQEEAEDAQDVQTHSVAG
jgi:hypothetical protein